MNTLATKFSRFWCSTTVSSVVDWRQVERQEMCWNWFLRGCLSNWIAFHLCLWNNCGGEGGGDVKEAVEAMEIRVSGKERRGGVEEPCLNPVVLGCHPFGFFSFYFRVIYRDIPALFIGSKLAFQTRTESLFFPFF